MSRPADFALAALIALAACSRGGESVDASAPPLVASSAPSKSERAPHASAAPPTPPAPPAPPAIEAPDAVADPWTTFDCNAGEPRAGKSVGHTSVVFKIELSDGTKVAFKPHSRKGPSRYKGEIAAYRLGRALDLPNVMPACFRTFAASSLAGALAANAEARRLFDEQVIVEDGIVRGALIPWFAGLSMLPLEKEPLASEFRGWLRRGGALPEDRRFLAAQTSTLIAFDYVTGNWDRWSGANVGLDKGRDLVLFIDNDGAFFPSPPKDAIARSRKMTAAIDRFSKSFVNRLRAMSDDAIRAAIGEERSGTPLLSRDALAGVLRRRRELLEIIDAKGQDGSADETLYFP